MRLLTDENVNSSILQGLIRRLPGLDIGQNEINCLKRAIAFLLWGGIALLVKGAIAFKLSA